MNWAYVNKSFATENFLGSWVYFWFSPFVNFWSYFSNGSPIPPWKNKHYIVDLNF